MLRMPWTLWRSVLADLLRLVGLGTVVLATVTAFGAAIKPLSDGALQAIDAIKFIGLAAVPMLAYALPFAAGFGATLAYHRMAQDNEVVGAYAGGISHRSLLSPALLAGVVLALGLSALNELVIPRFLQNMTRLVTMDVTRYIAQEIQRGRAVEFKNGRMMMLADQARRVTPSPESGATDQLLLTSFSFLEIEADGTPKREVTAGSASLWLFPQTGDDSSAATLYLRLRDVRMYLPGRALAGGEQFDDRIVVPNTFRDNPKYLTWYELRRLRTHPERMNWVDAARRGLVMKLAEQETIERWRDQAARGGAVNLIDERDRPVHVQASGLTRSGDRWVFEPPTPESGIRVTLGGNAQAEGERVVLIAREAALVAGAASGEGAGPMEYRLELARVRTQGNEASGEIASIVLPGVRAGDVGDAGLAALPCAALLERAQASSADPGVASASEKLREQLGKLERSVLSKRHERWAMSASVLVMVLAGAVIALRHAKRLPLTVYLWAFFPALLCLVTISGGQQLVAKSGVAGLWLMWGGVCGLLLYTLVEYRRVAQH